MRNEEEVIQRLETVIRQCQCAIVFIKSDTMRNDPNYKSGMTPDRIVVGDFIITNRFVEPQFKSE